MARVWKNWCVDKEIIDEIENYEPAELNTLLEHFYAELNNKKSEDHGPESLKVMMESLDRYLKNKGCTLSIVRDREFSSSKEVLGDKAKELRLAGRGKRPNKARQVSEEEEEILWKSRKLGGTRIFNLNRLNNSKNFSARFCSLQILKTSSKILF